MSLSNIIAAGVEKPAILAPKLVYRFKVAFCQPIASNIDSGAFPQYQPIPYLTGLANQVSAFDQGYEALDGGIDYGVLEIQFQDDVYSGARKGIEQHAVAQSLDVDHTFVLIFEAFNGSEEIIERTVYKGCRFSELIFGTYSYAGNSKSFKAMVRDPEKFSIEPKQMVKQFIETAITGEIYERSNSNGIAHNLTITYDTKETQFADLPETT